MSLYISNYQKVKEFHEDFNHPISVESQMNIFDSDPKLVEFRLNKIQEELDELKVAISNDDFIECIDAICDLMYFVYGSFLAFGVNFDELEKKSIRIFDFPKNYTNIFKNDQSTMNLQVSILEQHFSLLCTMCEAKNFEITIKYLSKLIAQCYTLGTMFGVDIDECFAEVHRSNMTKACLTEDIAKQSVEDYINKKQIKNLALQNAISDQQIKEINEKYSVYDEPDYRKSETTIYWIVYDKKTTKILKSIYFEKPNLIKILNFDKIQNGETLNENNIDDNNGDDVDDVDDVDKIQHSETLNENNVDY
jgi:predicted HAD superfamily Cof-like phosphohydrolase